MGQVHFTRVGYNLITQSMGAKPMERFKHYVGIDIANDDFTCSLLCRPDLPIVAASSFVNQIEGFDTFEQWLKTHGVDKQHAIICLEATGVYGEGLCYWLVGKGYLLAVEPPLKVKRAFYPKGHKNDRIDSKQIAEYAYRFQDKLYMWQPKDQLVEHIAILLTTREQLVQQKTATINAFQALDRKVLKNQVAKAIYQENIKRFKSQIEQIEKEIQKIISIDNQFKHLVHLLITVPGVGLLMVANLFVITNGFTQHLEYTTLAAMIGICPYQHRSGTSVWKPDQSARYGPPRIRKLLHLAARSVKTHNEKFSKYFARKNAEGKPNRLILNNIANNLLRIICAIIKEQKQYISNYVSINPMLLKNT